MNKQRFAMLIAAGLGALATFMPWAKAPFIGTITGTKGDGWITFILFGITIVICLLNDKTKRLEGNLLYGAIAPAIIASIMGIWKISDFNSAMSGLKDNPFAAAFGQTVSVGYGLYVIVLAGIAVAVLAFYIKDPKDAQ